MLIGMYLINRFKLSMPFYQNGEKTASTGGLAVSGDEIHCVAVGEVMERGGWILPNRYASGVFYFASFFFLAFSRTTSSTIITTVPM